LTGRHEPIIAQARLRRNPIGSPVHAKTHTRANPE
jgi:hypothetical protein